MADLLKEFLKRDNLTESEGSVVC